MSEDDVVLQRCASPGCTRVAHMEGLCRIHNRRFGEKYSYSVAPASERTVSVKMIYVVGFESGITKVGMTGNWQRRRAQLSAGGAHKVRAEAVFTIDPDEQLRDVESLVLAEVRERFPMAGGLEYFRADFDAVLSIVAAALSSGKIESSLTLSAPVDVSASDLSEMTGDQLGAVIRQFCVDHGMPVSRVVRWLGADKQASTIKASGRVPSEIADRAERLWRKPELIYSLQ